jgi:RNA polymerase sigma factor (sigma-70 family)
MPPQDAATAEAEFQTLLAGVRAGDPVLTYRFFMQYEDYVRRVARRQLNETLRKLYDSTDLVQEVWAQLWREDAFQKPFANKLHFDFFVRKVVVTVAGRVRRMWLEARCRSLGREAPLDRGRTEGLPVSDTGPEAEIELEDSWNWMLEQLAPRERDILVILRAGANPDQAAKLLEISVRTVQRIRERRGVEILP